MVNPWSCFFSGAIALILSWSLTGCRVGNHVTKASSADEITGYYETAPTKVSFASSTNWNAWETYKPGISSQIPEFTSSIMSNPIALKVVDLKTRSAWIANNDLKGSYFPGQAQTDGTVSVNGKTDVSLVWESVTGCQTQVQAVGDGRIDPNGKSSSGTKLPVSGRLTLSLSVIQLFAEASNDAGACTRALDQVLLCWRDAKDCHQEPFGWSGDPATYYRNVDAHDFYRGLFQPYLDSGAIAAPEAIPSIRAMGYDIDYQ